MQPSLRRVAFHMATALPLSVLACSSPFDSSTTDLRGDWLVHYTTVVSFAPVGSPFDPKTCKADFTITIAPGTELPPDTLLTRTPDPVMLQCQDHADIRWGQSGKTLGISKNSDIVNFRANLFGFWATALLTDENHLSGAQTEDPAGKFTMARK